MSRSSAPVLEFATTKSPVRTIQAGFFSYQFVRSLDIRCLVTYIASPLACATTRAALRVEAGVARVHFKRVSGWALVSGSLSHVLLSPSQR